MKKNRYNVNLGSKRGTHNIIIGMIGKNKNVLDVGCSRGYIGYSCDKSNKFWGLDYNKEDIKQAKEVYEDAIEYDLNNLQELKWNQKFDLIIFADILEHVLNPDNVIQFMKKYLKEGGEVIFSVPNVANWQVRFNLLFGNFDYIDGAGIMDSTHLKIYTFKTAKEFLIKNGFEIIEKRGGADIFGPIIYILPFLSGLLSTNIIYKGKYI